MVWKVVGKQPKTPIVASIVYGTKGWAFWEIITRWRYCGVVGQLTFSGGSAVFWQSLSQRCGILIISKQTLTLDSEVPLTLRILASWSTIFNVNLSWFSRKLFILGYSNLPKVGKERGKFVPHCAVHNAVQLRGTTCEFLGRLRAYLALL
jgi:hypothetical protein